MAHSPKSNLMNALVHQADGKSFTLPLAGLASTRLPAGSRVVLVDAATGLELRQVMAKAKAVGKDLWIESAELDQPLVLKDAAEQLEFFLSQAEPLADLVAPAEAAAFDHGLGTNYASAEPAGGAVKTDAGAGTGQTSASAKSGSIFLALKRARSAACGLCPWAPWPWRW